MGEYMNQKQRDYLIKRLEQIKTSKIAEISGEKDYEIIYEKAKKKIEVIPNSKLLKEIQTGIKAFIDNRISVIDRYNGSYDYDFADAIVNKSEIAKFVKEESAKVKEELYKQTLKIENKCKELQDKVMFAESYDDAIKIISEFEAN